MVRLKDIDFTFVQLVPLEALGDNGRRSRRADWGAALESYECFRDREIFGPKTLGTIGTVELLKQASVMELLERLEQASLLEQLEPVEQASLGGVPSDARHRHARQLNFFPKFLSDNPR